MKNHNELSAIKSSEPYRLLEKEVDEKIVYFEKLIDPEELKSDDTYDDDDLIFCEC